jgi:hypothetical protein
MAEESALVVAQAQVEGQEEDGAEDFDDYCDDGDEEEMDDEAAEARIRELTSRLDEGRCPGPAYPYARGALHLHCLLTRGRAVVGALYDTEEANGMLQAEIKQLLAEQDEQEELRNELHEQLRERGELMQMMAQQTVADSNTSTDILDRIQKLRAESELEKQAFRAEMDAMDDKLDQLARHEQDAVPAQVTLGPLDGVD